ncbi:hypothetical protein N7519_007825 [Penicillium mononematosum]|uniref:uncharacterized protein n=1 Tax=Penicillium mononematosum TaxID=268346 RepID=UPI002548CC59|nr:uncharacterized protein N7519_007825 [Penicillium mononematosum]KAJ6186524.1 hypothetical protein N7519_007825 [Penicillium mononematosum]
MIPKHFLKPGGPVAELEGSGVGTKFTDVRSESSEALDALPDDDRWRWLRSDTMAKRKANPNAMQARNDSRNRKERYKHTY